MSLLRLVLLSFALMAMPIGSSSAQAEDFTGFYAGVNAGYAFERDRHAHGGSTAFPDTSANNDTTGLPPSAQSASQSPVMRSSRAASPAPH